MPNKRIAITGGSGLVGKRLTTHLKNKGYEVAWVSRSNREQTDIRTFVWNVEKQEIDPEVFEWADGIIHLAGAGVADQRWSKKRKQTLYNSRINSSKLLYNALKKANKKPDVIVSASAIGYYGFETTQLDLDENAPKGSGFLADLTADWEIETSKYKSLGIRTAQVRVGIVLAKEGGAVPEMTRLPIIQPLGHGKQLMPWVHIDDLCRQFIFLLENDSLTGVFNGTAPAKETNRTFSKKLAQASKRIFLPLPVPKFMLALVVGEMAAMLLDSSAVVPNRFLQHQFSFQYTELSSALNQLYKNKKGGQ